MHGVFDASDYLIFKKRGGAGIRFLKASVAHAKQDFLIVPNQVIILGSFDRYLGCWVALDPRGLMRVGTKEFWNAGLVCVGMYLAFVAFFVANAEYCFHNDGLACLMSYEVPALPWILIFQFVATMLPLEFSQTQFNVAFYFAVALSVGLNIVLAYRFGRFFANEVLRKKS